MPEGQAQGVWLAAGEPLSDMYGMAVPQTMHPERDHLQHLAFASDCQSSWPECNNLPMEFCQEGPWQSRVAARENDRFVQGADLAHGCARSLASGVAGGLWQYECQGLEHGVADSKTEKWADASECSTEDTASPIQDENAENGSWASSAGKRRDRRDPAPTVPLRLTRGWGSRDQHSDRVPSCAGRGHGRGLQQQQHRWCRQHQHLQR